MSILSKTILLVEDEALICLAEAEQLKKYGYTVITAFTGEKAIQAVIDNPRSIDLILMDVDLGEGMSGTEAARQILQKYDIPILFLSSHAEPEIVKRTEEIINYGYVVKSSTFTVLDASIKVALRLFNSKRRLDEEVKGLSLSEVKFTKIFASQTSYVAIFSSDTGIVLDANPACLDGFGYSREEVIGKSSLSDGLALWEKDEDRAKMVKELKENGCLSNSKICFRKKNGKRASVILSVTQLDISGEKCFIASGQDITELEVANEKITQSEELYRLAMEASNAGIWDADLVHDFVFRNRRYHEMLGYELGEMPISQTELIKIIHPDDRIIFTSVKQDCTDNKQNTYDINVRMKHKDGNYIWVRSKGKVFARNELGKAIRMVGTITDISAEKKQEEEREKSALLYKAMFHDSTAVMLLIDPSTRSIIDANKAATAFYGYDIGALKKMDLAQINTSKQFTISHEKLNEPENTGNRTFLINRLANGSLRDVEVFSTPLKIGGSIFHYSILHDITERIKAEEKLRKSESRFRTLIEQAPISIFLSRERRCLYANDFFCKTFGYASLNEVLGINSLDLYPDKGKAESIERRRKREQGLLMDDVFDTVFVKRSGQEFPARVKRRRISLEDGEASISFIIDLSEKEQLEENLRKSEAKYRQYVENANDMIVVVDGSGRIIEANQAACLMTGYTLEELLTKSDLDIKYTPEGQEKKSNVRRVLCDGSINADVQIVRKDGSIAWCEVSGIRMEGDLVLNIVRDITEKKKIADELKLLTNQQQAILDNAPVGIAYVVNKTMVWVNKKIESLFQYHSEELVGQGAQMLYPSPEHYAKVIQEAYPKMSQGLSYSSTKELVKKNNTRVWVEFYGRAVERDDFSKGVIWIFNDVTDQIRIRDNLMASETKYRALFSVGSDALFLVDLITKAIIDCNEKAVLLTGYSHQELLSMTSQLLSAEPDKTERSQQTLETFVHERAIHKKNGGITLVEMTVSYTEIEGRKVAIAAMRDISARKAQEEKILHLLREKETILHEAHHRIKNNMTTVISYLTIKAKLNTNVYASSIINESIAQLRGMNILYDRLYRSEDTSSLSLREYLPSLVTEANETLCPEKYFNTLIECDEIVLDPRTLTTIGIIINELLTNSMKYAFAGTIAPSIQISASSLASRVRLVYRDNGIGLPSDFSIDSGKGFGMTLITQLAAELEGTICAENENGAKFTLEFPI